MKYLVLTCHTCWKNVIYLPESHQATVSCVHCGNEIRIWEPSSRADNHEIQPL